MTGTLKALLCERLFDGAQLHSDAALLVEGGIVQTVLSAEQLPAGIRVERVAGLVAPGFVDLQVNGGGGINFNDAPSSETIQRIAHAHLRFGTTAFLPTLITDTQEAMQAAINAVREATAAGMPGCLGLHLEGPFLAPARKGAHVAALMHPMSEADCTMLCTTGITPLLLTVAAEMVTPSQISRLAAAGVTVSIGHSDASAAAVMKAADAGARLVTHLFNAMSPLGHREPGVVGAALEDGRLHAGLIADGYHVDPAAIRIALRAKTGPGRIFLVTDAMATVGSDITEFFLNGRRILRAGGRLTLDDGTLAGVDLDMAGMVRFMQATVGVSLEEALSMASLYPADAIGMAHGLGRLVPGRKADFVQLDATLRPVSTYLAGERAFG